MVSYDQKAGEVLLSGGFETSDATYLNDTWAYHGGVWTNLTSSAGPTPLLDSRMVYDEQDGYNLVFGGFPQPGANDTNATWSFEAGTWTNLTKSVGNAPPAADSVESEMAYDESEQEVVLLERPALYAEGGGPLVTWTFANGTWENITGTAGPPPNGTLYGALASDPADHGLLQFGGANVTVTGTVSPENGTWLFQAGRWTNVDIGGVAPSPRVGAAMTYDPQVSGSILFGGQVGPDLSTDANDTWEFVGGNWTNITGNESTAPVATYSGYLVYDMADQYALYLGIENNPGNDTWIFGISPPFAAVHAVPTIIESNESYQLRVSTAGGSPPLRYNFSAAPPGCNASDSPLIDCSTPTAGSYLVNVTITDSLNRTATAVTSIAVLPAVRVGSLTVSPATLDIGQTARFLTNVSGGVPPYELSFSGLPIDCPSQNSTSFACTVELSGVFPIQLVATDSRGIEATATAHLVVDPPPVITRFSASRMIAEVGDNLTLAVNTSGGAPPLAYVYSGLPSGCDPVSTPHLKCVPNLEGTYSPAVVVSDAAGTTAGPVTMTLHVRSDLATTGIAVSPRLLVVGDIAWINVSLMGGVGPFVTTWTGLPAGCDGAGVAFTCVPSEVGSYLVHATVSDADGHSVNATVSLSVNAAASTLENSTYPTWLWPALAGTAVAVSALFILIALRRRKRQ
jgi:hypothetical protein